MKRYTIYIVCLLMLVMTVSCKKENGDKYILNARMSNFQTSKAYIDGYNYSCFRSGETIRVNNQTCTVAPNAQDGNRTCGIANVTESDGYYAFYPAGLLSGTPDISTLSNFTSATVILPQKQDFKYENGHQVIDNPMAGHLNAPSGTIHLQNLCALLKITVVATTSATINNIEVTLKGTTIWGTGKVTTVDNALVLAMDGTQQEPGDHSKVILDFCANGATGRQGNPSGETFYIVVPKTTVEADITNSIQLKFNGVNLDNDLHGTKIYKLALANGEGEIAKNTIRSLPNVSIGYQFILDNPKCVFTVEEAANGRPARKVTIAERSLIEHKNSHVWSCNGAPYHGISTNDYNFYFTYNSNLTGTDDWGWLYTINGNPPRTWRTPTMDEWKCILTGARSTSKNFEYVSINYSWGIILFPDNYPGPFPNRSSNISETNWNTYKNAGCVFLAGRGCGSSPNNSGSALGHGYYAAANSYNGSTCYCLYFKPKDGTYDQFDKLIYNKDVANTGGVNVRLVHDLN